MMSTEMRQAITKILNEMRQRNTRNGRELGEGLDKSFDKKIVFKKGYI